MNKKNILTKVLFFSIIFLLCSTSISSSANVFSLTTKRIKSDMEQYDLNNGTVQNTILNKLIIKVFYFGKIKDLKVENRTFSFFAINVREICYNKYTGAWGFSYWHFKDWKLIIDGVGFKGILKPDFICGVFTPLI